MDRPNRFRRAGEGPDRGERDAYCSYGADIIAYVAIAAAVASAGVSAYSSYQTGVAQKAAFDAEARQHELEAKRADLQSKQISALRLAELNANLAAISAARAGKNLGGDSPTEVALIRSFTRESLGARANEVLDARLRYLGALNAQQGARISGKAALTAGTLGAIGDVADLVATLGQGFSTPKTKPPKKPPNTYTGGP